MAMEPSTVCRQLVVQNEYAHNIRSATRLIESGETVIWGRTRRSDQRQICAVKPQRRRCTV